MLAKVVCMDVFVLWTLLAVLSSVLLLVCIALIRCWTRLKLPGKQTTITRSVVYLVLGSQLLVMQQAHKSRFRARFEVPKGKLKKNETAIDAAYRECYEEAGLCPTDLQLLSVFSTARRTGKHATKETWAAFWGTVPAGTTLPFTHQVSGKGRDRGRMYAYQLVPLEMARLRPPLHKPLLALRRVRS
jgi:ADP-ribose pyrophosphatase YjhB (NUDIX family)